MENQTETPFTDTGFDNSMVGAELFSILQIGPSDLVFPDKFEKMRAISEFANLGEEAIAALRAVAGKKYGAKEELLERLSSYSGLRIQKMKLQSQMTELEKNINVYE